MKLISCMQIDLKLSYKLIPLILVAMARPAKLSKIISFQNCCKKKVRNEVDFFVQMSIEVIYKLTFSFLRDAARHA